MTDQAAQVLAEALRLPESERGDLAARLLESLDPDADADVDDAWDKEIQDRIADFEEGRVTPLTWPEARRRILENTDESDPA